MTQEELYNALENNKYIVVRAWSGMTWAVNCKILPLAIKRHNVSMNEESAVMGYYPCSFQEYITKKTAYL